MHFLAKDLGRGDFQDFLYKSVALQQTLFLSRAVNPKSAIPDRME
jgi:hypothetical protein